MITHISGRDLRSGKLLNILGKLKDLICEKPRLGIREYTSDHAIFVEYKGDEIWGMIAWHLEKVQSPNKHLGEPDMDVIIIDTLCYKDDTVRKSLMDIVPVIHYPTGRSPGLPSGYTSSYNNEAEGDPKLIELPAAAAPESVMGGTGKFLAPKQWLLNSNNNNNNNNNSNYENHSRSRATNFTKKTEGPSAFFPKITVKTRHRRGRRNRRQSIRRRRV